MSSLQGYDLIPASGDQVQEQADQLDRTLMFLAKPKYYVLAHRVEVMVTLKPVAPTDSGIVVMCGGFQHRHYVRGWFGWKVSDALLVRASR
jgi:hypothetical protein